MAPLSFLVSRPVGVSRDACTPDGAMPAWVTQSASKMMGQRFVAMLMVACPNPGVGTSLAAKRHTQGFKLHKQGAAPASRQHSFKSASCSPKLTFVKSKATSDFDIALFHPFLTLLFFTSSARFCNCASASSCARRRRGPRRP